MFVRPNRKAVNEKIKQLNLVVKKELAINESASFISERRLNWFKENKGILKKYHNLPPEEKAYRIIFFDHMKINPRYSKMIRVNKNKIKIESSNFCPYLEACKELKLDVKMICKKIGEPSINKLCEMINRRLKFSRNYKKLRPFHTFCEEYIEIK